MSQIADLILRYRSEGHEKTLREMDQTKMSGAATEKSVDGMGRGFVRAGRQAVAARPNIEGFNKSADRTKAIALAGAKAIAGMAVAFGAFATLSGAVSVIREFESSVSKMGAISGATTAELAAMRDVAKGLGATTEFSSKQAADGLTFLAMAGFNAAESIAAIPAVLDLATASGMGLAQAADTASNIMSGFGIAATDAARVADVLAAASSRANTDVAQLGSAMSTVAPISKALDISLADTAAAIGVLSDAGIQGERAGTAMRGVLASLAGPTKEATDVIKSLGLTIQEVDPATNSLSEVMGRLGGAGLSTADAMTVFGREAASGALVMIEGAQRLGEFGQELRNVDGAAADMADTIRDNLGGDIDTLQSSISGLLLALGDAGLTAVLRFAVKAATGLVQVLIDVATAVSSVASAVSSLSIFQTTTMQVAAAADTANLAIADELAQVNALTVATGQAVVVSELVALNKLREAESHLASAEAKREEAAATILNSDAYQGLIQQIETTRSALAGMNSESAIGAAAYEETEQSLVAMLNRQQELLALIPRTSSEYEAAAAAVADLRKRIGEAKDGTVVLGGAVGDAADTTAALARLAGQVNFDAAAASAQSLASWLGISLSHALALAATTPMMADEDLLMSQQVIPDAQMRENQRKAVDNFERMAASLDKVGKSGGGASKAMSDLEKQTKKTAKEIERLEFDADPIKKYNSEIKNLDDLLDAGLSPKAYAKAVDDLNKELASSMPLVDDLADAFGDWIGSGFADFQNFTKSILNSFKSMISEMISTALRNKIFIPITAGITGVGGSVAAGVPGGGAGGGGLLSGVLGKALGGFGDAGSILGMGGLGGGAGLLGGLGNAISGGLGNIFSIGANAAAAGGGFLASVGAAIPVLGIAAAAISFFRTKTVELDSGLRIMAEGFDLTLKGFSKVEKSKYWGLSKKVSMNLNDLEASVAGPLEKAIGQIQMGIYEQATALGAAADTFDQFAIEIDAATKGLSEAEAQAKIQEVLGNFSNNFAAMIPGLEAVMREGEQFHETLNRITTDLAAVNDALTLFDQTLLDATISTAGMASEVVQLSGGMEAFSSKVQFMFGNMLTDVEQNTKRAELAMQSLSATFGQIGKSIPATHAEFMALVQAQDLTTAAGRETYAALLDVSGAFVTLYGTAQQAADGIKGLSQYISSLGAAVATNAAAVFEAEATLAQAEQTLESAISNLAGAVQTAIADADRRLDAARSALDGALRDLSGAIDREVSALADALSKAETKVSDALGTAFDAIDKQIEALENSMDNASTAAEKAGRLFEMLRDALDERRVGTLAEERLMRARAMAELRAGINDEDRMSKVLGVLNEPSEQLFGSFTDYARDFARTSALIKQQRDAQEGQLSEAEQQLELMQQQIDAFEAQKTELQRQYDVLMGIDQSVLSVADAVAAFQDASTSYQQQETHNEQRNAELQALREQFGIATDANLSVAAAVAAMAAAQTTFAAEEAWHAERMGYTTAKTVDPVEALYRTMLGKAPDPAGVDFWNSTGLQGEALVNAFRQGAIAAGEVPSFAGGGYTGNGSRSGGLDGKGGFMAMLHPRETVTDHTRGGTMSDADQRELLRLLRKIEQNTKDTTRGVDDLVEINEASA
ncbi:phage tail tape measure protein [Sulfitobacter pseudonitzschiae]|nr:phage tail tape measure protein [Pseudosulfitobacter pseudonitzschiae]MBM2018256.1 phage tail tape measure protein [Pseudosulfitobacter pseudonitzschiae]